MNILHLVHQHPLQKKKSDQDKEIYTIQKDSEKMDESDIDNYQTQWETILKLLENISFEENQFNIKNEMDNEEVQIVKEITTENMIVGEEFNDKGLASAGGDTLASAKGEKLASAEGEQLASEGGEQVTVLEESNRPVLKESSWPMLEGRSWPVLEESS